MSAVLIDLLPDLVFLMRRDGSVVAHVGGQAVPDFRHDGLDAGDKVEQIWSPTTAALIKRLLRRSITRRAPVETRFQEQGRSYELRISPQRSESRDWRDSSGVVAVECRRRSDRRRAALASAWIGEVPAPIE